MKRRTFLLGTGGVALAAPFLGTAGRRALAGPVPAPKRLVVFFQPNGVNMEQFFPTVTNGALTEAAFADRGVSPVAPFRNKLLVPRGIHMSPKGFGLDGIAGCDHRKGMACKLTAVPTLDDGSNFASSHSVDFEAAWRINPDGADPLVIQVGRRGNPADGNGTDFCSFSASNTPYPGENNPWNIYRSLAGIIPGGEAEDLVTRRRQSIVDLVRDDLDSLRRVPMSGDDQQKIDDWLALLRDSEMLTVTSCGPDAPSALGLGDLSRYEGMNNDALGSDSEFRENGRTLIQLMALTMLCDANRVATLQWSRGSGGPTFRWDGISHDFNHHQISHRTGRDDGEGSDLPGIEAMITDIDRWYGNRFGELLGLFDAFEEDSGTMLDHSAVMWINELSDGKAHHFNNLPIVIGGSAGGYLRQGVAVDCSASGDLDAVDGAPHNKLLTTLLNAVGARADGGGPIESFGDLRFGQPGEYDDLRT
jgi:hypothetical protein